MTALEWVSQLMVSIFAFQNLLHTTLGASATHQKQTPLAQSENRCYHFQDKFHNRKAYVQSGDISIGGLFQMTDREADLTCGTRPRNSVSNIQYTLAMAYAVNEVNEDPTLLPHLTLGFAILDDCDTVNTALASALSFLPVTVTSVDNYASAGNESESSADTSVSPSKTVTSQDSSTNQCFDVIGLIGPIRSFNTISISYLFAMAQIPMVSFTATSDDLSDRDLHPYFMRLVPPDLHQVKAMMSFISEHGWSYISVVYFRGSYGENGFDNIKLEAPKFGVCIATAHRLTPTTNYTAVIKDLLSYPRARVIILFAYVENVKQLFDTNRKYGSPGHFIWIGSDGVTGAAFDFLEYKEDIHGAFTFSSFGKPVADYEDYLRRQRVNESDNPWLKLYWETIGQCTFDDSGTCGGTEAITDVEGFDPLTFASLIIDSVYTYAHAVHNLMADHCPNATGQAARQCITGPLLLDYMMKSDFNGTTGRIRFDSEGSLLGKYNTLQYTVAGYTPTFGENRNSSDNKVYGAILEDTVAVYDLYTDRTEYDDGSINWDHLAVESRVVPLKPGEERTNIPESVCSRPCGFGELRIQVDPCCWECRTCRSNERISLHKLSCEPCEDLTWPDPSTELSTCQAIPLSYPAMSDTLPLLLIVLGLLAIVSSLAVFGAYIYLREARVIKAASRELSFLQIGAILIGYVTVLVFQAPPSHVTCSAQYFLFCFSFSLLYAPMLIKAVRIFRIFQSSQVTHKRPRFVSPLSQIAKVTALVAIQVIICIIVVIIWHPSAVKIQPVRLEKFVELSCDMTLAGLTSFLCYNLVLVTLCSILAFKTRTLPDNFNESRFTSMCVSTTLVIWLAFVPTYFTATRTAIRALSLSVALLLNHTVALVFLFLPKIYAAVYLPELATRTVVTIGTSSRVGPMPSTSVIGQQVPRERNGSAC